MHSSQFRPFGGAQWTYADEFFARSRSFSGGTSGRSGRVIGSLRWLEQSSSRESRLGRLDERQWGGTVIFNWGRSGGRGTRLRLMYA